MLKNGQKSKNLERVKYLDTKDQYKTHIIE